ncbi:hypothetical protein ACFL6M_02905 [Candidatus Eisenbacteria bacterium]|uniref:Uncharacterized protein n=1 Tax=Eiseniibacteriota bacterium TaxID=2212470 RepID=A0ABV6YJL4_UNCEI
MDATITSPCLPYAFTDVQLHAHLIYWLLIRVADYDLDAYPCDGSLYRWTLEGFTGEATPVEPSNWGTIKRMFR